MWRYTQKAEVPPFSPGANSRNHTSELYFIYEIEGQLEDHAYLNFKTWNQTRWCQGVGRARVQNNRRTFFHGKTLLDRRWSGEGNALQCLHLLTRRRPGHNIACIFWNFPSVNGHSRWRIGNEAEKRCHSMCQSSGRMSLTLVIHSLPIPYDLTGFKRRKSWHRMGLVRVERTRARLLWTTGGSVLCRFFPSGG